MRGHTTILGKSTGVPAVQVGGRVSWPMGVCVWEHLQDLWAWLVPSQDHVPEGVEECLSSHSRSWAGQRKWQCSRVLALELGQS